MDSVTLSGAWRARYSRKASVKSRLSDLRVRRARRSAPSNKSLGMEIAVFIPRVWPHDQFLARASFSFISTSAHPAAPARQSAPCAPFVWAVLLPFPPDSRGAPPTLQRCATSRDRPQSHLYQPSARGLRSGRIALPPNRNFFLSFLD